MVPNARLILITNAGKTDAMLQVRLLRLAISHFDNPSFERNSTGNETSQDIHQILSRIIWRHSGWSWRVALRAHYEYRTLSSISLLRLINCWP